jgi:hypothetical protein
MKAKKKPATASHSRRLPSSEKLKALQLKKVEKKGKVVTKKSTKSSPVGDEVFRRIDGTTFELPVDAELPQDAAPSDSDSEVPFSADNSSIIRGRLIPELGTEDSKPEKQDVENKLKQFKSEAEESVRMTAATIQRLLTQFEGNFTFQRAQQVFPLISHAVITWEGLNANQLPSAYRFTSPPPTLLKREALPSQRYSEDILQLLSNDQLLNLELQGDMWRRHRALIRAAVPLADLVAKGPLEGDALAHSLACQGQMIRWYPQHRDIITFAWKEKMSRVRADLRKSHDATE